MAEYLEVFILPSTGSRFSHSRGSVSSFLFFLMMLYFFSKHFCYIKCYRCWILHWWCRYLKTGPGNLEKDVERRFSYALSREDIENAVLGGPWGQQRLLLLAWLFAPLNLLSSLKALITSLVDGLVWIGYFLFLWKYLSAYPYENFEINNVLFVSCNLN